MNTEIFDYFKALSKKEFFYVNFFNLVCSVIIIFLAIVSLRQGATMRQYAIMFGCATVMLALNSYKCFKRGSKAGWSFAIMCAGFLVITGIAVYAILNGGQ